MGSEAIAPVAPDRTDVSAEPPRRRAFDDVRGMTEAELRAHWGAPESQAGVHLTYRFPEGCSERKDVYELRMRNGRVAEVKRRQEHTGMFCQ